MRRALGVAGSTRDRIVGVRRAVVNTRALRENIVATEHIDAFCAPLKDGLERLSTLAPHVPASAWVLAVVVARIAARCDKIEGAPPPAVIEFRSQYCRDLENVGNITDAVETFLEAAQLLRDDTSDAEMRELAREELHSAAAAIAEQADEVQALVERRTNTANIGVAVSSSTTWTIEVLGRAGGVEANLFAQELRDMIATYLRKEHSWAMEVENVVADPDDATSGASTVVTSFVIRVVGGEDVYQWLSHEIGTHRVQRVPVTESSGRMQTSTASVTMMPSMSAATVDLKEEDCEITMVRGSGPGGQGVNSSSNAVRLKHKPTGITVSCHQSRSGLENRNIAMDMVAQKLWVQARQSSHDEKRGLLVSQWTSGERADRIRTYNFAQNRITDHRCKAWSSPSMLETLREATALKELHQLMTADAVARNAPAAMEATLVELTGLWRQVANLPANTGPVDVAAHLLG